MKSKALVVSLLLGAGSIILIVLGLWYLGGTGDVQDERNAIPERIRNAFDGMDSDRSGAISLSEFELSVKKAEEITRARRQAVWLKRIEGQFHTRDEDGDGFINQAEYAKLAIVKRLDKNAPNLSLYDKNEDQQLDLEEYINFRSQASKMVADSD